MEIYLFLGGVCIIYAMLMFFDYFFKSCMMLPYIEFLQCSGISVKFFRLQFHTTKVNRTIVKWSTKMPSFYKNSFKLGCYLTGVLFPVAFGLVIASLFSSPSTTSDTQPVQVASRSEDMARLEILLPGVNLPLSQIGYYVVALLICSVVHEAGHGIAAVLEDVPLLGFGLQLLFIIPIAYTEIDIDQLQSMKMMKKLKIFTAGIWNNILLAGFSYIILLLLPFFLSPVYETSKAVFITKIIPRAPIKGENGLFVGDRVVEVNGCQVTNEDEWMECLQQTLSKPPAYCVSEDFVHDNEESIHEVDHLKSGSVSCCDPKNPAVNCFENPDVERLPQYICLNIRKTVEHSENYCQHTTQCPDQTSCLKPVLSNFSTIIHMKRKNRSKDLVYYGHPHDVLRFVIVSDFTPKTKVFEPWFGDSIALMLKYLTVFSSGLALVNVLPCYGMDGQFLINALIANLPSGQFSKSRKEVISNTINLIGSGTLLIATIKIIYRTFI